MKHDPIASGKRKPVNVTLDTGIVAAAREAGINLSQISEEAIRSATRAVHERRWADDHAERINAFSDWLDEHGMPFADLRVF